MPSLEQAAVRYAELGFYVFPLNPKSKEPATDHGFKDASNVPETVRAWWIKNPDYNIGIAAGHGLVIIDVDNKPEEGKYGTDVLRDWERQHGEFIPTWTVLTGTGGLHYWFHTNDNFTNTTNLLGAIDIRSDGAYVVAPPSIHPNGTAYEWEASGDPDEVQMADLKGSAFDLIKDFDVKRKCSKKSKTQYKEYSKIKKGERQTALMSLAGTLKNLNMTDNSIMEAIRAENNEKCDPPFTEEELEKTIFKFLTRDITPSGDYSDTVAPSDTLDDGIEPDALDIPTLDKIPMEKAEWLEMGYIPKKTITIVCGDGGVGKTSIWCSLAAAVSRGEPTFLTSQSEIDTGIKRENKKVLFFSAEDAVSIYLKAKLREAGAVEENIYLIDVSDKRFKDVKFNSAYLEKLIAKIQPALCIFDPLQAFIEKKVKMAERNAMRQEMEPLIRLGQTYDTAFVLIMHTNKQSNVWGRQRMADSADLWDVARSVLMVGTIDEKEGIGYISQEKNSYAKQSETVIYKISRGIATWYAKSSKKDKDYVKEAVRDKNAENSKNDINDACDFILSTIEDTQEKRVAVKDLDDELKAFGFSSYAIRNAKKNLKDSKRVFYKKDGYEGKSYLSTRNRQD